MILELCLAEVLNTGWIQLFKIVFFSIGVWIGNKGYDFLEKNKDKILIDNILGILLEDIFRQLIFQRIRIKDSLRIFKDKDQDKDFWAIWKVYAGSNIVFWI